MLREMLHHSLRYGEIQGEGAMTMKRKNLLAVLTLFLGAVVIGALWPSLTKAKPGTVFRDCPECPEMVVVPAGSFRMGDLNGGGFHDEKPVQLVTIQRPFAVGKYEVTVGEYLVCVNLGSCREPQWRESGCKNNIRGCVDLYKDLGPALTGDRHPIIGVSWNDAREYAAWLSRERGKEYRLLSESEWEYAARAGTGTKWSCGNKEGCLESVAWYAGNSGKRTHPVGQKKANGFGLCDMHGNVWEWVEDCLWPYGSNAVPTDGSAAMELNSCSRRIFRGGAWSWLPRFLRSATRYANVADDRNNDLGFRVARTISQ
jgi:formylglycine-generating enzyme required for sulfatase activity